jgi:hypothetical protein
MSDLVLKDIERLKQEKDKAIKALKSMIINYTPRIGYIPDEAYILKELDPSFNLEYLNE